MNAFDIAFDGCLTDSRVQADQTNQKPLYQPSEVHRIRLYPVIGGSGLCTDS